MIKICVLAIVTPLQTIFETRNRQGIFPDKWKMPNAYKKNLDANPSIDTIGIFLDMSKASDKVWHKGLLSKLKSYGIISMLLGWCSNYIQNKKQQVVLNGITYRNL